MVYGCLWFSRVCQLVQATKKNTGFDLPAKVQLKLEQVTKEKIKFETPHYLVGYSTLQKAQ